MIVVRQKQVSNSNVARHYRHKKRRGIMFAPQVWIRASLSKSDDNYIDVNDKEEV